MAESQRRSRPRSPERGADRGPEMERGLRGLVGSGPSQVGSSAAMRARDAARPTEADEAAAEDKVRLVRRNYKPPPPSGSAGTTPERS